MMDEYITGLINQLRSQILLDDQYMSVRDELMLDVLEEIHIAVKELREAINEQ